MLSKIPLSRFVHVEEIAALAWLAASADCRSQPAPCSTFPAAGTYK